MAGINGQVNGSFIQEGYYTFAVSASDKAGETADSFVTINVQPKGTNNSKYVLMKVVLWLYRVGMFNCSTICPRYKLKKYKLHEQFMLLSTKSINYRIKPI